MATPIIMPRQGQSVESCIISKWNKKKGDSVAVGDILFSYETDKASFDEEAKVAGMLLDTFFEEGDDVPCLINVCVIGKAGESTEEFNPNGPVGGSAAAGAVAGAGVAATGADAAGVEVAGGKTAETEAAGTAISATATAGRDALKNPAPDQKDQLQDGNGLAPTGTSGVQNGDSALQPADGPVKISPRARNLAEKSGVDYRYANATGPYGRIIERDILDLKESGLVFTATARAEQLKGEAGKAVTGTGLGGRVTIADLANASAGSGKIVGQEEGTAAGSVSLTGQVQGMAGNSTALAGAAVSATDEVPFEEVKLPNIRKVIAKAMHQSLSSMAQLTLNGSFDVTDILDFRKKLKENKERLGLENITINDIIIYAVSRTLANHKVMNAHFLDDRMLYFKNVNIGVAVDTERGLMVPTLFNANRKSLNEISAEVKKLVKDCQTGTINPDLLKNGSFTITNLGTLDVESFTPVINPPQTGILGVNNIMQRARDVDGEIEFYPAMGLSLTFDHRAVDGAPAARFLKDLKTNLESFSSMLAR